MSSTTESLYMRTDLLEDELLTFGEKLSKQDKYNLKQLKNQSRAENQIWKDLNHVVAQISVDPEKYHKSISERYIKGKNYIKIWDSLRAGLIRPCFIDFSDQYILYMLNKVMYNGNFEGQIKDSLNSDQYWLEVHTGKVHPLFFETFVRVYLYW